MEFSWKLKDWFLDHIRQQKKCVLLLKLLYFILFYVFIFLFGFVNRGLAILFLWNQTISVISVKAFSSSS